MNVGSIVGNHKSNCRQILDFWVDQCPRYGSLNFDQKALTDTGQSVIYQVLYGTYTDDIYIYTKLKVLERAFWANNPESSETLMKGSKLTNTPSKLDHSQTEFFFIF